MSSTWSAGEIEEIRLINKKVERDGNCENVDADESAIVKQFFKNFDPELDEELYTRTVRNLPIEHDEAMDELERT